MATIASTILPSHPFWHFSLAVQEQEMAKQALLALQNKHGLNINLLLFCCWHAATNQGQLHKQEIKLLLNTIENWHESIVLKLRTIHERLKPSNQIWANNARQEILAVEQMGEHIEQLMLIDMYSKKTPRNRRSPQQLAANACQNIGAYAAVLYINLDQHDCALAAHLLKACFPEITNLEINHFCKAILIHKPITNKALQKQLMLI